MKAMHSRPALAPQPAAPTSPSAAAARAEEQMARAHAARMKAMYSSAPATVVPADLASPEGLVGLDQTLEALKQRELQRRSEPSPPLKPPLKPPPPAPAPPPPPEPEPEPEPELSAEEQAAREVEKKKRGLIKKLKQIEDLVDKRRGGGAALTKAQAEKVAKMAELVAELRVRLPRSQQLTADNRQLTADS